MSVIGKDYYYMIDSKPLWFIVVRMVFRGET